MFNFYFINKPFFLINDEIVKNIFCSISKNININQNGNLNIIFVSPEDIKKYNNDYRKKDNVTDVLSFHYYDDFSELKTDDIAGEILFCEEKIVSQAIEYGLGNEKEFYKLLIHSILHILGFDHETDKEYNIMKKYEDLIWQEIFEKN